MLNSNENMYQPSKISRKNDIWQKNIATTWSTRSRWKSRKFLSIAHLLKIKSRQTLPAGKIYILYWLFCTVKNKICAYIPVKKNRKSSLFNQRKHFFLAVLYFIIWKALFGPVVFRSTDLYLLSEESLEIFELSHLLTSCDDQRRHE